MAAPIFQGGGLVVEEIGLATGGTLRTPTYFEVPATRVPPPNPPDPVAALYGVDLQYPGDFVVRGSCDLSLTEEFGAIVASFVRALVTSPGEIPWWPSYGVGLADFLNLPATPANAEAIKNRIRSTLMAEPAIEAIDQNDVALSADGIVALSLRVTISGHQRQLRLGIRKTS